MSTESKVAQSRIPAQSDVSLRGANRIQKRTGRVAWLFLAPAAFLFILFLLVPIGYAIYLSLHGIKIVGGAYGTRHTVFVGFANYAGVFSDSELRASLVRLAIYGIIVVPLMLGFAALFALLLDSTVVRFSRFSRLSIFLSYAVPGVVGALLWGFMYLPGVSPIRAVATDLGLPAPNFFTPHSVFLSVANIAIWGGIGFNMIVMYTSLRAMPQELFQAARIDGCNERQLATKIKLPMLRPALMMTGIFGLISTIQVFNEPSTLRPMTDSISSTWVPLLRIYNEAFVTNDVYSAAATSVVLALVTLLVSAVFLGFFQKRAFEE